MPEYGLPLTIDPSSNWMFHEHNRRVRFLVRLKTLDVAVWILHGLMRTLAFVYHWWGEYWVVESWLSRVCLLGMHLLGLHLLEVHKWEVHVLAVHVV